MAIPAQRRPPAKRKTGNNPPLSRMIVRALLRRCPRCGGKGAWFTGWFARSDRCHTCGYKYERQDGFLLGALTINTIVTFGLFGVVLTVGSIVTYPHIDVLPILLAGLAVAVLVPILLYPISYTFWAVIDLSMRPLEPAEEADALTALAARDGGST